jgi:phosphatidylserine decarboxylase
VTGLAKGTPWWVRPLWVAPSVVPALWLRLPLWGLVAVGTWFFRDPDRTPQGPGLLAPADGVVREVSTRTDGGVVVSTYLNLFDVHVTRAPCDGVVAGQQHHRGSHRAAFRPKSHLNERVEWLLETDLGDVRLVQIAGAVARRIVPYAGTAKAVGRGERIGLIRYGSRVDVVFPSGVLPCVSEGERVSAGATVIARVTGA